MGQTGGYLWGHVYMLCQQSVPSMDTICKNKIGLLQKSFILALSLSFCPWTPKYINKQYYQSTVYTKGFDQYSTICYK